MRIYHKKPCPELRPFINRYWSWESINHEYQNLPEIITGTGSEVFFHLGEPFQYVKEGQVLQADKAHLVCIRQKPVRFLPQKKIGFIVIRFCAGMFRHFCRLPMGELIDSFPDIEHFWNREGTELAHKIREAHTFDERINLIETFLLKILGIYKKDEALVDYAVRKIYYGYRELQISKFASQLGLSRRHFRRIFTGAVGISPKSLQRYARFENTIKKLLINQETNYLPEILKNGYFDQSHFIKDFQFFSQKNPSKFLTKKNFMSHFYNTPFSK